MPTRDMNNPLNPNFDAHTYSQTPPPVKKYIEGLVQLIAEQQRHIGILEERANVLQQQVIDGVSRASRRGRVPRSAVFVSDVPRSREAKLAHGLKKIGWSVILLHREVPTFDANSYFTETHSYKTAWEALSLASEYSPVVFHLFSNWNYDVAAAFIKFKPGKIVFDDYDVMAGMVRDEIAEQRYPGQLQQERFCLEHADGLCCRSLETQYAKKYLGYRYRGKRILMIDCCWADEMPVVQPKRDDDQSEVHIVFCGNLFDGDPSDPDPVNYQYDVAALLSSHRIHYHIYPPTVRHSENLRQRVAVYLQSNGDPKYVHVHNPVPPDTLVAELSKYDYGLHILSREIDGRSLTYADRKFRYATANKIFDYIDANLHILSHSGLFQGKLATRYRSGTILKSLGDLLMAKQCRPTNTPRAFSLSQNIRRLVHYYATLVPVDTNETAGSCFR